VLTPDNIAHLQTFPRPPNDNGRGIHFGLDLRQDHIDRFKPMIADLDIKWVLVYAGDEQQIERAATAMWQANEAFVVARPAAKIDRGWPNWEGFVQKMQQVGVPPYIQIFNEPGDDREWDGRVPPNYEEIYAQKWIQAARRIVNAGGYPGVQILGEDEWNAVAYYLNRPENQDIKERTFFALHNYGINHPPDYPYNEGLTIFDDDVSILSFLAYAKWQQDTIGMVLPMIGGEGGWGFTNQDDPRYPKIMEELHAQYHGEMFDWFRTGVIGNGEPLPDYLLSIAPWILYCYLWPMDQWYYPQGGEHLPDTINAVKSIPPFIRQFSWD